MPSYIKQQPKDGDFIFHCGHLKEGTKYEFFRGHGRVSFTRPDGSAGSAVDPWIVVCQQCDITTRGNPEAAIRGDSIWKGNDPVIIEPTVN